MNNLFVVTAFALAASLSPLPALAAAPPSDAELQKFVAASREVNKISTDAEAKVKAVKTNEEALKIDEDASARMEAAVQKQGLTTDRYTEIYESMQSDDKVKSRVAELVGKK